MAVVEVTDATFEDEVLKSELPVLVDLQAEWCQPCKQLSPIVAEVAQELVGKLKVCAIDIDKSPMVAQMFRVQSIPMLVVLDQGRPVTHHMGLLDKAGVLKLVEAALPADASEVQPEELAALLQQNRALPVDIRDENQFARYRIPGAINVPKDEAKTRATELNPTDGRIRVLYARTTDEAKELAEQLRSSRVEVAFLAGGFLHWEADGFTVERG